MTRALILLLLALSASSSAAIPAGPSVIPWRLTTQCVVGWQNVPVHDPYPIV
jgi:hypothetical protein